MALVGGVDTLRTVEAVGEGTGEPPLLGLGKATVVARGPLHGRAYGESSSMRRFSAIPISSP